MDLMLTNTKNIRKNLKLENVGKETNGLEMWWIGSCPRNLAAWMYAACTPEIGVNGGRTNGRTDACTTTEALLTKSSRAKNDLRNSLSP